MTWGDYNAHQNMDQRRLEMELQQASGARDPDKPPRREIGDGWIALGLLIGAAAGAAIGGGLSYWFEVASFSIGLVTGAVAGAFLGVFAGDRIKKITARRRYRQNRSPGR